MKALITGASSGIGASLALILSQKGYDLILVARREKELQKIKSKVRTRVDIITLDLSIEKNCYILYEQVKDKEIDIVINNAGFGVFGKFTDTSLKRELEMIDINIKAVHIITKLFLKDFVVKNKGHILNVSSSAAFLPGPLMASYYASKAYVLNLTESIYQELKEQNSKVYIGALCPGPVDTNFNQIAGVTFKVSALTSKYVAHYAINQMFKRKLVIIPGKTMKLCRFGIRFLPKKMILKISYNIQKKKEDGNDEK